jgi:hypothetical protein
MIAELLFSILLLFVLLVVLVLFFIRHQSKMPYYRLSQAQCVVLLEKAIQGTLPEYEWHAFIGVNIRDNEELEMLREKCLLIDDLYVKKTHAVNGHTCVVFNKDGVNQLKMLLDEWRHKSNYVI